MAKPLSVIIPHSLGEAEARRRIEEGFATVQAQLSGGFLRAVSFQNRWEANRMHFEGGTLGQKITGRLDVEADSIHLQIDLPDLLVAFADQIKARVKQETGKLLEKK